MQPGYEDTWYYLWRERRLPVNVDPFDSQARRRDGARAPAPRLHAGAGQASVGYLLPLKREWHTGTAGPKWITGSWFLRDERLYLMPGDSPMGYRLPLDSLPWAAAGDAAAADRAGPVRAVRAAAAVPRRCARSFSARPGYDAHACRRRACRRRRASRVQAQPWPGRQRWPALRAAPARPGGKAYTGPHLPEVPPARDPDTRARRATNRPAG